MRFESNAVKIAPQAGILFRKRFIISPFLLAISFLSLLLRTLQLTRFHFMRKIFMLCLAGALALAAASCKEDKKVVTLQTITVSGQMYEVKSAFYTENPAEEGGRGGLHARAFPDGTHDNPGRGALLLCRNRDLGIALRKDHRPYQTHCKERHARTLPRHHRVCRRHNYRDRQLRRVDRHIRPGGRLTAHRYVRNPEGDQKRRGLFPSNSS